MKAPIASSGTSGDAGTPLTYRWSVTRPALFVYGTWPPGSAWSSQTVPLKTSSLPAPLSVVSVTTVPAGDVSVMSMSAANVWRRNVTAFRSQR